MKALQTGSPLKLEIIGEIEAPAGFEPMLHDILKEHRAHGEWFNATTEVLDVVEALINGDTDVYELAAHRKMQSSHFWSERVRLQAISENCYPPSLAFCAEFLAKRGALI